MSNEFEASASQVARAVTKRSKAVHVAYIAPQFQFKAVNTNVQLKSSGLGQPFKLQAFRPQVFFKVKLIPEPSSR